MTIVDIAALAGVSVSTVSRVISQHPDVSEKTKAKVRRVIEENAFVPNNSARNLKRESFKAVAVIVKGFSNTFFGDIIPVIQKELEENNYAMLMHQLDANEDEISAAISICKDQKPRALIFMGGNFRNSAEKLAHIDVPYAMLTVTMLEGADRANFSSITIDDFKAGYDAGSRMTENGHVKIAAIASSEYDESISRLRLKGFIRALEEKGVAFDETRVVYAKGYTQAAGYECAKKLLAQTEFTCLFCVSDIIALGAIRAIYDAGLSVPKDISVMGIDGLVEGKYSIPALTTLQQPGKKMAEKCVKILLRHLRSGAPHEHHLFTPEFIAGESFLPRAEDAAR